MTSEKQTYGLGFSEPIIGVILGANGGIAQAMIDLIIETHPQNRLILTTRSHLESSTDHSSSQISFHPLDITDEEQWFNFAQFLSDQTTTINLVINVTGLLHKRALPQVKEHKFTEIKPEKSLKMVQLEQMSAVFSVNTFAVALALKFLSPFLSRSTRSIFASLSARVGSISDNQLGGWYSYRASKAAQNMLIKTASIELSRSRKKNICVGLHPGTVATKLSEPFSSRVTHQIFTPQESASYLLQVLSKLNPSDTGKCFAWDGQEILP